MAAGRETREGDRRDVLPKLEGLCFNTRMSN